ncbi:hypothetical protein OG2516_03630 [Oceanicola granulosus HTCC2516]|uniref:L,D-TPase catalytic domain-containing protein n=1 Tax=Oceanicola granulosus (strain ATCC BAA-861 / DSM 15982 / KCTC 12143 / HTCC2516) TaxID=314256 RepID=Q2CG85_OCEGH|nr:L,D-transpeptidase family protein [Oceanicola granulosus]EAR51644.1 hypothetical protein OG2516_03630 [Oceanicola granulosus HTCC2516]
MKSPSVIRTLSAALAATILTAAAVPEARAQATGLQASGTQMIGAETIRLTAFRQAVAERAARDETLAAFYRARDFEGIWSGEEAAERRSAFVTALAMAPAHGLPASRYDPDVVRALLTNARTPREQGQAEVELSRYFLAFARDLQSGVLDPGEVIPLIKREVLYMDPLEVLKGFADGNPMGYLRALAPTSPEYQRLLRARMEMQRQLNAGGYGPTVSASLERGATGEQVVALRDRLTAMGFLAPSVSMEFDAALEAAVRRFQVSVGLTADGVVGGATLDAINVPLEERLRMVLVAMERERWMNNLERGQRHIWVNLVDYTAAVVDEGHVTFRTKSVIGAGDADRQTPEFSDVMDHMVINPSWYVPRSITVNEYLPSLRRNRNAVSHLQVIDRNGRVVNRNSVNFSQYNARTFPYSMRQPPGSSNALGQVKFMFPNRYNIYLHDTPSQHLFSETVRTFSHGCIRLDDPYEFAHALLAAQEDDPVGFFQTRLDSGNETRVNLETPVPVHLVYRTAFTTADGVVNFRPDAYGRDGRIWDALAAAGVAVGAAGL